MLQESINKIKEYFMSIEIKNDTLIVKVSFEKNWGVYPSSDEKIQVTKQKNDDANGKSEWIYYGNINEISVDDVFNLIYDTTKMNIEASLKLELLTKKFDELKKIFAEESLERLNSLVFVFNDVISIKPKKRKYTRHKKVEVIENKVEATENDKQEISTNQQTEIL